MNTQQKGITMSNTVPSIDAALIALHLPAVPVRNVRLAKMVALHRARQIQSRTVEENTVARATSSTRPARWCSECQAPMSVIGHRGMGWCK